MSSDLKRSGPAPDDIFRCRQCGECCRGFGGTLVNAEERRAIAAFLGISAARFEADYCVPSGRKWVIAQGEDGFCRLFRDKLCGIHPVKPRLCRSWPFIPAVLVDPANWRAMAAQCPGMVTDLPDDVLRGVVARAMAQCRQKSSQSKQ
ncbi:MAG: YkgJ family cysteine cluster protein [Desulfobacterales bacterium]|jgi:Fe-S-cluster containining protein